MIVRLERTISATPRTVYRAWLEPDLLRRWLAPGGLEVTHAEVDERVGGRLRIWQSDQRRPAGPAQVPAHDSGSDAGGFDCELVELVPDERIVFRWGFVGPDPRAGPAYDSLLTITLRAAPGGGTALTLVHERLDELAAALPDVAANVGPGWEMALDKLTATIGG